MSGNAAQQTAHPTPTRALVDLFAVTAAAAHKPFAAISIKPSQPAESSPPSRALP
jgi:hypothetical protein